MGWSAGPAGFLSLKLFRNITALTWKFGEVMEVSEVTAIVLVLCYVVTVEQRYGD